MIEGQSQAAGSSRRRSSITFPSPTAASATPRFASSSVRAIPRSQSSLDLWHVGVARPRELSVRQMSSKSSNIALPDVDELEPPALVTRDPPRSTRVLGQPNRVLMDLAGLDLPGRPARTPMVRRNSTAAMRQSKTVPELGAAAEDLEDGVEGSVHRSADDETLDKKFYTALVTAQNQRNEHLFRKLVKHYRSSRAPDAFDIATKNDPELAKYPLPSDYSIYCYNTIIEGLLKFRQPGESVSPILEIYNELLDRGCVPNGNTYGHAIRALCIREQDVWRAVKAWDDEKRWARWRAEKLGVQYDAVLAEHERDQIIDAYIDERNFESAIKLFGAATMMRDADYRLRPGAYKSIIQAAVTKCPTAGERQAVLDCYSHASSLRINSNRAWRGHLFLLQAATESSEGLETFWQSFRESDEKAEFRAYVAWLHRFSRTDNAQNDRELMAARSDVWVKGAIAYAQMGDTEQALRIWSDLVEASKDQSLDPLRPGPPIIADVQSWGSFGSELLKANLDKGVEFWRNLPAHAWRNLHLGHILNCIDTLIYNDRFDDVLWFLSQPQVRNRYHKVDRLMVHAIDHAEVDPTTRERAFDLILEQTERKKVPLDVDLLKAWLRLILTTKKRNSNIFAAFSPFEIRPVAAHLGPQAEAEVKKVVRSIVLTGELDLRGQIALLMSAESFVDFEGDDAIALAVGRSYLADPNPELSVHQFERVFKTILAYSVDDGELDDVLVRMAENLATQQGKMDRIVDRVVFREFERKLVHRFGQDRAKELLTPLIGAEAAERVTGGSRDAPSTPGLTDADTASEYSLPPLPEMAPPVPENSSQLVLSYPLSNFIDRHTLRRNAISLDDAYKALTDAMRTQRAVAHPEALARLFDNLARAGREKETREIYSLAHYIAENMLPEAERAAAWYQIECYMLIAACHLGRLEEAGMYRARILQAGMVPSAEAYATMIASSKDTTDDALVARELFDESRALGVKPNLFLYNTIISKLSKARKAELALDLFKTMKASGIRPSSVTYGAVIVSLNGRNIFGANAYDRTLAAVSAMARAQKSCSTK